MKTHAHRTLPALMLATFLLLTIPVAAFAATYNINSYADLLAYAANPARAGGDVLVLQQDIQMDSTQTTAVINLTGDLTIRSEAGEHYSITGNGNALGQLLRVKTGGSSTVTVEDVTLKDGNAGNFGSESGKGGALYVDGNADLTHCTLDGNTAIDVGGAVYVTGNVTLDDTTITGSQTSGAGGGISAGGNVTVKGDSHVDDNKANGYGGGISAGGTVTISDGSTVSGNDTSAGAGGGLYVAGDVEVTSSTVKGNESTQSNHGGGGIFAGGAATVTDSTLADNTTKAHGGGLRAGSATITGSAVLGNTANSGGGVHTSTGVTVTDSTVSGNTARGGGGISNDTGAIEIENSIVEGNTATTDGGGISTTFGAIRITDSAIENNTAGVNGGGISSTAKSSITVTDSTISGNTAAASGGGIYASNTSSTTTIINSVIADNTANDLLGGGGGIYSAGSVSLDGAGFSGNSASGWGNTILANSVTLTGSDTYTTDTTVSGPSNSEGNGIDIRGNGIDIRGNGGIQTPDTATLREVSDISNYVNPTPPTPSTPTALDPADVGVQPPRTTKQTPTRATFTPSLTATHVEGYATAAGDTPLHNEIDGAQVGTVPHGTTLSIIGTHMGENSTWARVAHNDTLYFVPMSALGQ